VQELFSAYEKYAQARRFRIELVHSDDGHIIANIKGPRVGRAFRHESGQHCCQRIPDTETKGRKQTSFISVAVLPLREDVWEPLRESDLEVITQTGKQGAGGQNVNKVASAVRMKHKPSGLSVFINGRDQGKNRAEALKILTARVNDEKQAKVDAAYACFRRDRLGSGARGDKIRTYNFMEGRVTDHRLGTKTTNVKAVMKGDLDLIIS
jgi:peptide chain release factor 1